MAWTRFGQDLFSLSFSPDQAASPDKLACQRAFYDTLAELRVSVVDAVGPGCSVLDVVVGEFEALRYWRK
jgi:hypothetical protein